MDVNVRAVHPPRGGDGALRDHDEREPGAHARHRHAREPRPGARHLRPLGGRGPGRGQGDRHRPAAHPRRLGRRRCSPTSPRPASTTTPRATTGPWPGRRDLDAVLADDPGRLPAPKDCGDDLLALLIDPTWVYRQYDHQLFLNTVVAPGGDAALLRLKAPGASARTKGLALSTDGNGRWCALDPRPRHVPHRGRVRPQRGLRGRPAGRPGQLPQLRQSGAPRGHVAAVGGDRRHERGVPAPSASP